MGFHPINLAVRFVLELIAFVSPGYWAWKTQTDWYRYPLMILLPIVAASIWGVFAVPKDPSRSGKTVVAVPGLIRLIIELLIFTIGAMAICKSGYTIFAWVYFSVVILHYIISYDRVKWLLEFE